MMRRRDGRGGNWDEFNEEPAVLLRGRERGYFFLFASIAGEGGPEDYTLNRTMHETKQRE